jgi:hypothetical protein
MKFIYSNKEIDYIVSIEAEDLPEEGEIEVTFVARVNGGRGRMPKTKVIDVKKLVPLIDFNVVKNLYNSK